MFSISFCLENLPGACILTTTDLHPVILSPCTPTHMFSSSPSTQPSPSNPPQTVPQLPLVFVLTGKILVHCAVGVSRSATLVLAYLMLYHHLTLVEAIKKVKDHRGIIPNRGFLRQLLALDRRLRQGLEA